jgi:hypothetical protein
MTVFSIYFSELDHIFEETHSETTESSVVIIDIRKGEIAAGIITPLLTVMIIMAGLIIWWQKKRGRLNNVEIAVLYNVEGARIEFRGIGASLSDAEEQTSRMELGSETPGHANTHLQMPTNPPDHHDSGSPHERHDSGSPHERHDSDSSDEFDPRGDAGVSAPAPFRNTRSGANRSD